MNENSEKNAQTQDISVPSDGTNDIGDLVTAISECQLKMSDNSRSQTFKKAIQENSKLFKGKVVLEVGCELGMLSMLAAQAGAAKVIAVDFPEMAKFTKDIVRVNKLEEIITVIGGKIEEIELPSNVEKVDIIIGDWVGYCLFYKCKLNDVLYARDKWLKPDGYIFPDRCSLFLAGVADGPCREEVVDWWDYVYGFDMSCARSARVAHAHWKRIKHEHVVTNHAQLIEIQMYTAVRKEELRFKNDFQLMCRRNDYIHGLITFFTVEFTKCPKRFGFSTSPHNEPTFFNQTVFYLHNTLTVKNHEIMMGTFEIEQDKNYKEDLHVSIKMDYEGTICEFHEENEYVIF